MSPFFDLEGKRLKDYFCVASKFSKWEVGAMSNNPGYPQKNGQFMDP